MALGAGTGSVYGTGSIDVKGTLADEDIITTEFLDDVQDAVVAIETLLGATPEGVVASVQARLDAIEAAATAAAVATTYRTQGQASAVLTTVGGESVLTASSIIPSGVQVRGVFVEVDTTFGATNGLTGFHVGALGLVDRWGNSIALTIGTKTNFGSYRGDPYPRTTGTTDIILTAVGGDFDATGQATVYLDYEQAP